MQCYESDYFIFWYNIVEYGVSMIIFKGFVLQILKKKKRFTGKYNVRREYDLL